MRSVSCARPTRSRADVRLVVRRRSRSQLDADQVALAVVQRVRAQVAVPATCCVGPSSILFFASSVPKR